MNNPLLIPFTLPPFSTIKYEDIVPAITAALKDCYTVIKFILETSTPYAWETLIQPLSEINDRLHRIFSSINHLNSVKNSSELRKSYEQALLLMSRYNTWLGQHENLFHAYLDLKKSNNYIVLDVSQKKVVDNGILNFKLSGIELKEKEKKRYGEIIVRLSDLELTFSNNVLDATIGWNKLIINKDELLGIPESFLKSAKKQAAAKAQDGWLLTLDIPSYLSVITYSDNADLRQEVYRAYSTRASDQGPNAGKWDNSLIMAEELTLRYELAQLLGFKSYADKSLVTKMAKSSSRVMNFLTDLTEAVYLQGKKEFAQLCSFAKKEFGVNKVNSWDLAYYSEKQKQQIYAISDEKLRPYFPEPRVIKGLFEVIKLIYGITTQERSDIDFYHPDVRFFELFDESTELRGSFYLDLYTRENKRSGAWMDECVSQMRKADGSLQKPVAYIICNFNRPINGKPALFTHNEVITLFHEFGHGLHHLLTRIEACGVSGISGVPWDAVEFPSQFMENWCWEPEVLSFISGHYETDAPLPPNILDNLILSKNYQSAMSILRQLEFSLFDFSLHNEFYSHKGPQILKTLNKIKKKVSVVPTPEWDRFPHVFSHIFSGNYAASYYSYLWSNVLAADAYSRFKTEGIFNRQTGQSFLDNILSCGGSEDPMELFERFRGRKPQLDAMLKYCGIKDNNKNKIPSIN